MTDHHQNDSGISNNRNNDDLPFSFGTASTDPAVPHRDASPGNSASSAYSGRQACQPTTAGPPSSAGTTILTTLAPRTPVRNHFMHPTYGSVPQPPMRAAAKNAMMRMTNSATTATAPATIAATTPGTTAATATTTTPPGIIGPFQSAERRAEHSPISSCPYSHSDSSTVTTTATASSGTAGAYDASGIYNQRVATGNGSKTLATVRLRSNTPEANSDRDGGGNEQPTHGDVGGRGADRLLHSRMGSGVSAGEVAAVAPAPAGERVAAGGGPWDPNKISYMFPGWEVCRGRGGGRGCGGGGGGDGTGNSSASIGDGGVDREEAKNELLRALDPRIFAYAEAGECCAEGCPYWRQAHCHRGPACDCFRYCIFLVQSVS